MSLALKNKSIVALEAVDPFCDGIAIKRVGDITYEICKRFVDEIYIVDEGKIANKMIDLFQNEGVIYLSRISNNNNNSSLR